MNYSLIFTLLFNLVSLNLPVIIAKISMPIWKNGTLNKVNAAAEMEEVKSKFTCFASESKEGEFYNCSGAFF